MTNAPMRPPAPPPSSGSGRAVKILLGLGLTFGVLFVLGTLPRLTRQRELRAEVEARNEAPLVRVMAVRRGAASSDFTLPGTAEPIRETPVHARSTG